MHARVRLMTARSRAPIDRRVDVIINERTSGSALNLFDIHATYNRQTLSCTFPSPSPPSPAFQLYPTSTTRHFVIVIPGSPSTSEKSGESSVKSMHPRYGNSLTGIYRRCALRGQTRSTRLQRHQGGNDSHLNIMICHFHPIRKYDLFLDSVIV